MPAVDTIVSFVSMSVSKGSWPHYFAETTPGPGELSLKVKGSAETPWMLA